MCIYEKIFKRNNYMPDKVALKYEGKYITYEQLNSSIQRLSIYLKKLGMKSKEKVIVLLPNCSEFIISFFSIIYGNGVVILADIKFNEEIYDICNENDIKLVITNEEGKIKINKIWNYKQENKRTSLPLIITTNEINSWLEKWCTVTKDYCNMERTSNSPSDDALILYTSGSTGGCKGVLNLHSTLEEALDNYISTLDITSEDIFMGVTPFFHSYCMGSCMLASLVTGSTIIVEEKFQPRKIMKLIDEEKVTIFQGVPYMYQLMTECYSQNEYTFNNLKYFISAGAKLNAETSNTFYQLSGRIIHQEYGSTETGTMAINLSEDLQNNIISVGQSLHNVQLRIYNQDENGIGLIQIKSKGQAVGYIFEQPFGDNWFNTGDIGRLDEKGFIYILGREKRIINVAGIKVNPYEVEDKIKEHAKVADVMVKGLPHPDFGEIVQALVVKKNNTLSEDELIDFCKKHLALYKAPQSILFVESLKKSGTGKNIL